MRRMGIAKKIILLIVVLLVATSVAIIILNSIFYQRDMRDQLADVQLPLISDKVLAEIDAAIMEPTRASMLLVDNPFFLEWIRDGEPEAAEKTVFDMLDSLRVNYNLLASNFGSEFGRKYYNATSTGRQIMPIEGDGFSWFFDFRDSREKIATNIYVGDKQWGTAAYINARVEVDGQFRGNISIGMNLETLAEKISALKPGRDGAVFMMDGQGVIRFIDDTSLVGEPIAQFKPAYGEHWQDILRKGRTSFSYRQDGYERIVNVSHVPDLDWYLASEVGTADFEAALWRGIYTTIGISLVLIVIGSIFGMIFSRSITRPLEIISRDLAHEADAMSNFADEISKTSDNLDVSARQQAAVVDGASASITEMSGLVGRNADNAASVNELMRRSDDDVQAGLGAIQHMTGAMDDISHLGIYLANTPTIP